MLEELRVSLFAQALGTPKSVSPQRVSRLLDELSAANEPRRRRSG